MKPHYSQQTGYSIIEVMVSVLVLAIGFLGMAGLQTTSLQNSQRSVLRTQAAYLSYEIVDKMRVNKNQEAAYAAASTAAATAKDCLVENCTATDLVNFDVAEWRCALGQDAACGVMPAEALVVGNNGLPEGLGTITYNAATDVITVTVEWNEQRDGTTNDLEKFELITKLN